MQPSEEGLSESKYYYETFPAKFDRALFNKPRKTHDYSSSFIYKSCVTNEQII